MGRNNSNGHGKMGRNEHWVLEEVRLSTNEIVQKIEIKCTLIEYT